MPSRKQIEAKPTSELLDDTYQLAMEARVRASMAVSDYRRGNLARLRRAHRAVQRVARLAADLASAAFRVADLLEAEVRTARNRNED
jgi:hypothetical protein